MTSSPPPGAIVEFNAALLGYRHRYRFGIVVDHGEGRTVRLRTVGSDYAGMACHEIRPAPHLGRMHVPRLRRLLPYGVWTYADGREVLFNRDYEPLWQRSAGGGAEPPDVTSCTGAVGRAWYYQPGQEPWRDASAEARCREILRVWGVGRSMAGTPAPHPVV